VAAALINEQVEDSTVGFHKGTMCELDKVVSLREYFHCINFPELTSSVIDESSSV